MAGPRLVLFDLDDTLCDYSGARVGRLHGAFGMAFAEAGVTGIDLDEIIRESVAIHPHGSDHFPALLARHGVENPDLAIRARRWYHHNRFLGLDLFPEARDVIREIRALPGVAAIGLITNGPAEVQRDKIALLDLNAEIDFAVVSGELGIEKPDPRIFQAALELGSATPPDSVYIGDSPEFDMEGAHSVGIDRIWVNPNDLPWLRNSPPPAKVVRTISEVPRLLANQ
jgi:putative hydrolase of the HAD superfamily